MGTTDFGIGLDQSKANRKINSTKRFSAQRKRLLSLEWLGRAWETIHGEEQKHLHDGAWRRTGCAIEADGTGDELIKQQGLPDFKVMSP